jgi:hypothetical protein
LPRVRLNRDAIAERRRSKWRKKMSQLSDAEFAEELERWQRALRVAGDTSRALDRSRNGLRDEFVRYCSPISMAGSVRSFAERVEGVRRRFQEELSEMESRYDELMNMRYRRLKQRGEVAEDWGSWLRNQRFASHFVLEGEHDGRDE